MSDLILMIVTALGAVAGAAAILATMGIGMAAVTAAAGGAASMVTIGLPTAVCAGGAVYVASRTGYGGG